MKIHSPVLVLAGGFGTRLRSVVSNVPKPMAPVKGKPFLEWLVSDLVEMGAKQIILSTGYLAHVIEDYPWKKIFKNVHFEFLREETPLGPGGAVEFAFKSFQDLKELWVVNGDTLLVTDWPDSLKIETSETAHFVTQLNPPTPHNVANLCTSENKIRACGAMEKPTHFDTGFVFIRREALPQEKVKLPYSIHDLLKPSIEAGRVGYTEITGEIFDIGTPEKLGAFDLFLSRRK